MEIVQWIIQVIVFVMIILVSVAAGSAYSLDKIQQKKRAKKSYKRRKYIVNVKRTERTGGQF